MVPGVKSCVGEGGCPLLGAGEVDDAHHDDDHQGEDQQEDAGNPTLNHWDEVANQDQAGTRHKHQGHNCQVSDSGHESPPWHPT